MDARADLAAGMMNCVCEDHEALIITRNGQQSVVKLSLEDYNALEEAAYLLHNPTNAKRPLSVIGQLKGLCQCREPQNDRRLPLVQRPGTSHGSIALVCRAV